MVSVARKKPAISSTEHAGLRILTQIALGESNVVVKSGLKSLTRTTTSLSSSSVISSHVNVIGEDYCFLKSCNLCNNPLSPDKDVYMYRGDEGFCSEECRSRQIKVEEEREMDAKIKKGNENGATTSFDCSGCETCRLLQKLRQQRNRSNYNTFSSPKPQPLLSIFS